MNLFLTNVWIRKTQENETVKIAEWASKNNKKVEDLKPEDIQEALRDREM